MEIKVLYFDVKATPPSAEDINCELNFINKNANIIENYYTRLIKSSLGLCLIGLALICVGAIVTILYPESEIRKIVTGTSIITLIGGVVLTGIFADKKKNKKQKFMWELDNIKEINSEQTNTVLSNTVLSNSSIKTIVDYSRKVLVDKERKLVKKEYYMIVKLIQKENERLI